MSDSNTIERHVVQKSFGRGYQILEGRKLTDVRMTKAVATALAKGNTTVFEVEMRDLRERREQLFLERKTAQARLAETTLIEGRPALLRAEQLKKKLAKIEAAISRLLAEEVAIKRRADADGKVRKLPGNVITAPAPVDNNDAAEIEDAIAELEKLTRDLDANGATPADASRVVYLLARLRFYGLVKHPSETVILQVDRLMRLKISSRERKLKWSTFAQWPRRPASTSSAA